MSTPTLKRTISPAATLPKEPYNFRPMCMPATVTKQNTFKATEVKLTYGREQEILYLTDIENSTETGCIETVDFLGEKRRLNKNFIVSSQDVTLLYVETDTTAHYNACSFHSTKCKKSILHEIFRMPFGTPVTISNSRARDGDKMDGVEKLWKRNDDQF